MHLVIVESPTKAKTISKFLPKEYKVESSFGHVRDLPQKEMGIDIDNDFTPRYVVPAKAEKQVGKLQALATRADKVLFATDEDREGEAIAWHLRQLLNPEKYERITFHEITPGAITASLKNPRDIDLALVDAQQARRVLDRLVGYELSPFLWKKVAKGLSAGRVQSVAVRLIVEREREIRAFKTQEYWTIDAEFSAAQGNFPAKLHSLDGKTLNKFAIADKAQATDLVDRIKKQNYAVAALTRKEVKKKAPEPFRTSTLQQEAANKLGFSSKETMLIAQQLYEGVDIGGQTSGLITYMRTDSLNLSNDFLNACHSYIKNELGPQYAAKEIRRFKTKSKGAQEAHEAIRCTDASRAPQNIKGALTPKQFKLYDLIWRRSLACQMTDAVLNSVTADIVDACAEFSFRATGQTVKFDGYLKIYPQQTKETLLPPLKEKQPAALLNAAGTEHFTEPPARYNDASLIKILEEYGIGRPSTYAPTLTTIQDRNYVIKEDKKYRPTDIGEKVTEILEAHFPQIVDYQFTAEMEEGLDKVADKKKKWVPLIAAFYGPFKENLTKKTAELKKKDLTEEKSDEVCPKCGAPMVVKIGRYGKFLACSAFPKCKPTKKIGSATENSGDAELAEKCPECGATLVERRGKFGKFIGCSRYPDCKYIKKTAQETGITCPECKTGQLVARRGKKRLFYGCSNYPKCTFTLFAKPTGETCRLCGALIVYANKNQTKCSNKDCPSHKVEAAAE